MTIINTSCYTHTLLCYIIRCISAHGTYCNLVNSVFTNIFLVCSSCSCSRALPFCASVCEFSLSSFVTTSLYVWSSLPLTLLLVFFLLPCLTYSSYGDVRSDETTEPSHHEKKHLGSEHCSLLLFTLYNPNTSTQKHVPLQHIDMQK